MQSPGPRPQVRSWEQEAQRSVGREPGGRSAGRGGAAGAGHAAAEGGQDPASLGGGVASVPRARTVRGGFPTGEE